MCCRRKETPCCSGTARKDQKGHGATFTCSSTTHRFADRAARLPYSVSRPRQHHSPQQTSKTLMGLQGHSLISLPAHKPNSILAWAQEQGCLSLNTRDQGCAFPPLWLTQTNPSPPTLHRKLSGPAAPILQPSFARGSWQRPACSPSPLLQLRASAHCWSHQSPQNWCRSLWGTSCQHVLTMTTPNITQSGCSEPYSHPSWAYSAKETCPVAQTSCQPDQLALQRAEAGFRACKPTCFSPLKQSCFPCCQFSLRRTPVLKPH